jgi:hypothetical protein
MSNATKSLVKPLENVSAPSDRTHSSAAPVAPSVIIYTPIWTHKSFMKNVPTKQSKKNDKSIVDRFVAEQTSDWYSTKSVIPRDGRQSELNLSGEEGSSFDSASTIGFQSKELPSNSISPTAQRVSRFNDDTISVKFRNPTPGFRDYRSFDSSQSVSNDSSYTTIVETERFYPVRASTNLVTCELRRVLNLE